jgi:HlyD family secretion protein
MKVWLKVTLCVAAFAAGIAALRLTVFRAKPVPVTVAEVELGRVEDTVVNSRAGAVKSRRRASMSPAIAGRITEILAVKGTRVAAGDLLLRLDDQEHAAHVRLCQSALEGAQARARQAALESEEAQRQWERTQALARERVVSETLMDQEQTRAAVAAAAEAVAAAGVREATAALDAAEALLAKTAMKAPFDGVVLEVTTEVGEWISPAPPGVFIPAVVDLIDPEALYVSAPIDEADVSRLQVELPTRITLDAFPGRSFPGTLTYVSSFVETRQEQNRTLEVEATFAESELPSNLLPGLSADVEIILDARDPVLRIPTYALMAGDRVMVLDGGLLAGRRVETGLQNWNFTEVRTGLRPGEQVVVSLDRPEVVAGARAVVATGGEP